MSTVSTTTPIPIEWPTWGIVIAIVVPVALILLFIASVVALCVTCYCLRKRRLHELTHPNVRFLRPRDVPAQPPDSAPHTRAQLITTANFSQPGEYTNPSARVANGGPEQSGPNRNATASNHWGNSILQPPGGVGRGAPTGLTWNAPIQPPKRPGAGSLRGGSEMALGQRERNDAAPRPAMNQPGVSHLQVGNGVGVPQPFAGESTQFGPRIIA